MRARSDKTIEESILRSSRESRGVKVERERDGRVRSDEERRERGEKRKFSKVIQILELGSIEISPNIISERILDFRFS